MPFDSAAVNRSFASEPNVISLPEVARYFGSSTVSSPTVMPLRSACMTPASSEVFLTPTSSRDIVPPFTPSAVTVAVGAYMVAATPLTWAASLTALVFRPSPVAIMSTLYRDASASPMVCLALAAPVAMVATRVTPISSAVPVAATRRGFFWMLAWATLALGPHIETSAPTPRISTGSQNVAVSTSPRNTSAAPPMDISSTLL